MKSRKFEEVENLVCRTDERWSDRAYIASLRLKSLAVEAFCYFLFNTLKIVPKCSYDEPQKVFKEHGPKLLAIWHGDFFTALSFYRNKNIAIMASLSKDGDLITKVLDALSYDSLRGSSSKGGARVLLEAIKKIREKVSVAFTVDGPRGPYHKVKPGIVKLAQKTGIPIVHCATAYERYISLHSWDKMRIPLPFSKCILNVGEPFYVHKNIDIEEGCRLVEAYMDECDKKAEEMLKVGC